MPENPRTLRAIFNEAVVESGAVGAQLSLIVDGKRLDLAAGSANVELQRPMLVNTIVQVGSVCKVFNAALVMKLVEDGHLELDRPVIDYVPEFACSEIPGQEGITLRRLLSMSSGLDNGPYVDSGDGPDGLARFVAAVRPLPLIFSPGAGFGYSNAGATLAGFVAQRVMGVSWDDLLQTHILAPADLIATTRSDDFPFFDVSAGHTAARKGREPGVIRPWYISRSQGPSGSTLTMNAAGLASFGQVMLNGGVARNGRRILSGKSVEAMMTPTTDVPIPASLVGLGRKWGLGPCLDDWGGSPVWVHGGGNRSGVSIMLWAPEQNASFAFVLNTPEAIEPFAAKIFGEFTRAALGISPQSPTSPAQRYDVPSPQRYSGEFARFGTRIEIVESRGGLRIREHNLGLGKPGEALGLVYDCALIPLAADQFMFDPADRPNFLPESVALAGFFGNDDAGRATHVVTPILAAKRL